jgi:hypothetical protein
MTWDTIVFLFLFTPPGQFVIGAVSLGLGLAILASSSR